MGKFQRFSPNPRGFIYHPIKFYYFMGIPHSDVSHNGGPCNGVMRMKIFVHPNRDQDTIPIRRIPIITSEEEDSEMDRTTMKSPTFLLNDRIRKQLELDRKKQDRSAGETSSNNSFQNRSKSRIVQNRSNQDPGNTGSSQHHSFSCRHYTLVVVITLLFHILMT